MALPNSFAVLSSGTNPNALKSVGNGHSWHKPVVGVAIAASVAILAILGVQQGGNNGVTDAPEVQSVAQIQTNPSAPGQFSTLPAQYVNGQSINAPAITTSASSARMNSYMVNYNEFRTSGTKMQGMLPYVRIIANDAEEKQK